MVIIRSLLYTRMPQINSRSQIITKEYIILFTTLQVMVELLNITTASRILVY